MNDSISPSLYKILTADFLGLVGKLINSDMKKFMFIATALLMSLSASAQFTVFEPVIVDRNGNWVNRESNSSRDYNNSYDFNMPQPSQPSQQQQQSQVFSTRGYYINNNQWVSVLLKVKVIEDNVYVVGIKRSTTGWSNESIRAYSTELMQKEIKDNFDYYIGDYVYGKIYF